MTQLFHIVFFSIILPKEQLTPKKIFLNFSRRVSDTKWSLDSTFSSFFLLELNALDWIVFFSFKECLITYQIKK